MISIVGVQHGITQSDRFSSYHYSPPISKELSDFLEGKKVGLELNPPALRNEIRNKVFFDNSKSTYARPHIWHYDPYAWEYFENLEKRLDSPVYLPDESQTRKIVCLDKAVSRLAAKLNETLFDFPDREGFMFYFIEEHYDSEEEADADPLFEEKLEQARNECWEEKIKKSKNNPSMLLSVWSLKQRMQLMDWRVKEETMLQKIAECGVDVAVVGLGHALYWQSIGLPFEYYMEDMSGETPKSLRPLNPKNCEYDFSIDAKILEWKRAVLTKPRINQPTHIGLFGGFKPKEYFELFLTPGEKGNLSGTCFDSCGQAKVVVEESEKRFVMRKQYVAHTNPEFRGAPLSFNFEYNGEHVDGVVKGNIIRPHMPFFIFPNNGDALKTLRRVYRNPPNEIFNSLLTHPPLEFQNYSNPLPRCVLDEQKRREEQFGPDEVPF